MKKKLLALTGLAALIGSIGGPAVSQDNSLFILQNNSAGGAPNALFVDQSRASESTVGTAESPVEQIGGGNRADIMIMGNASGASLSQQNAAPFVNGNTVSLELVGNGLTSLVAQSGSRNFGTVFAEGDGAQANLFQDGDFNRGEVFVAGPNASGTLRQEGNGNDNGLRVEGPGTEVTYSVIGDNLTGLVAPSVVSNGATVTITQTVPGRVP